MTGFNDVPIRVSSPVRVQRVDMKQGGLADRHGIKVRKKNRGRTVDDRRLMAHEMAHMMDFRDLDDRQRQHIGQAILGGKWDAEKFAEYAAWATVMPKKWHLENGNPSYRKGADTVSTVPNYGVRLTRGKLDMLRKWLVNVPLYRKAQQ